MVCPWKVPINTEMSNDIYTAFLREHFESQLKTSKDHIQNFHIYAR